jgi:hypothetical protein
MYRKGLKPYVVKVTSKGKINGAYDGKNVWDELTRSQAPRHLDVSIIHVKSIRILHIWQHFKPEWMGFLNTTTTSYATKGFEDYRRRFLRGKEVKT